MDMTSPVSKRVSHTSLIIENDVDKVNLGGVKCSDHMGQRRVLITGGAGFIGSNLANHFIKKGEDVLVFDNFYRKGVHHNVLCCPASDLIGQKG